MNSNQFDFEAQRMENERQARHKLVNEVKKEYPKLNKMVYCSDCKKEVSAKAFTCPHCGNQLKRSFLVAGVMAITPLGWLGIHNYYLGRASRAKAQMLIFVLGAIFVIPSLFIVLWSFIEGLSILSGGQASIDGLTQSYGVPTSAQNRYTANAIDDKQDEIVHL